MKSKNQKTVAIVYGWAEGDWQSRALREFLVQKGLKVIDDIRAADIIFCHSSGCYLVPRGVSSKNIMLVGLPYWPGRTLLSSVVKKLSGELSYHRRNQNLLWWLNKIAHNSWYILSRPSASYYVITRRKPHNLPDGERNKVHLIRPNGDTFCHPNTINMLHLSGAYRFIEIDGAHDDCWLRPKPYIELLLKELQ